MIYNRYISANMPKTDQVRSLFAATTGEMYPAGLYLYDLEPDVLSHCCGRFLVGP